MPGTTLVAVNDATAQQLFGEPGMYDAIVAAAADGCRQRADVTRAQRAGDPESRCSPAMEDTESQQDQLHEDLSFFNTIIMAFAFVALFVGTFIIYNTFSILVAQRQKESAMLRAIGAGRRQLLRSMLLEAARLGAWRPPSGCSPASAWRSC